MTLAQAVSIRVRTLLKERQMTQYHLEQISFVPHATMNSFLNGRNKACNLTTVVLISRALGMTLSQFFDDPIFESDNLLVGKF